MGLRIGIDVGSINLCVALAGDAALLQSICKILKTYTIADLSTDTVQIAISDIKRITCHPLVVVQQALCELSMARVKALQIQGQT